MLTKSLLSFQRTVNTLPGDMHLSLSDHTAESCLSVTEELWEMHLWLWGRTKGYLPDLYNKYTRYIMSSHQNWLLSYEDNSFLCVVKLTTVNRTKISHTINHFFLFITSTFRLRRALQRFSEQLLIHFSVQVKRFIPLYFSCYH